MRAPRPELAEDWKSWARLISDHVDRVTGSQSSVQRFPGSNFGTDWSNFGGSWREFTYTKDHRNGLIVLSGLVAKSSAATAPDTVLTIAPPARPNADMIVVGLMRDDNPPQAVRVDLNTDGELILQTSSTGVVQWLSVSGFSYFV